MQPHIYTVNEITTYIKNCLEEDEKLQDVWVKGEISNFKSFLYNVSGQSQWSKIYP